MKDTLQYAFVARYAAVAHVCPNIAFKPGAGYLSNVVDSTVGQIIDDGESAIITIPGAVEPKDVVTETEEVPSIGERIISEEEDIIGEQAPIEVTSSTEGLFVLDDLYGINEGELDEDEKNASVIDETAPAKEQFCHGVCRLLTSKSKNADNVVTMEEAAKTIATQVSSIYNTLQTDVNGTVNELSSKISAEVERIDSGSGAMFLAEQLGTEDPILHMLDWNRMSSLGTSQSIIEEARRIGGLKGSSFSFTDARMTTRNWKQTAEQTDIPDNVKSNIIQTVEEQTGESSADDVSTIPQNDGETATMYDETETDDSLATPIETSEAIATESFNLFGTDIALQVPGVENRLTDMVRSVRDVITTTNSKLDRLKKINPTAYRSVSKDKLGSRKVKLLDKKFVNDFYRSLDGNYANVTKLLRMIESTPRDAAPATGHTIKTMAQQLGKTVHLQNSGKDEFLMSKSPTTIINEHMSEQTVKDSNWTLQDIQGTVKASELAARYKPVSETSASIGNKYLNKFTNPDVANAVLYALFVCEYHHYCAACLLSAMVKTMLRVAYAYDDALKQTSGAKEAINPKLDDLYGEHEGEADEDEKNASELQEEIHKSVESLGDTAGLEDFNSILHKAKMFFTSYNSMFKQIQAVDFNKYSNIKQSSLRDATCSMFQKQRFMQMLNFLKTNKIDIDEYVRDIVTLIRKSEKADEYLKKYEAFGVQFAKAFDVSIANVERASAKSVKAKALNTPVNNTGYSIQDLETIKMQTEHLIKVFNDEVFQITKFANTSWLKVALHILAGDVAGAQKYMPNGFTNEARTAANKIADIVWGFFTIAHTVIKTTLKFMMQMDYEYKRATKKAATESISKEVYPIVATKAGYARFMKQMHHAMNAVDTSKQVPELLRIVDKYPKVLKAYKTIDFGISTIDSNNIKNNTDAVMDILNCVGYHLLVCRKYFNDNGVLILDKKTINKDVMTNFESQAGCVEDIQRHLLHRYLLLNVDLPNTGIRAAEILRNKVVVAQEHAHRIDATKRDIEMSHGGAIVVAYNKVLMNYMRNLPSDRIPKGMTTQNFVKSNLYLIERSSAKLRDASATMDDCLFKFVLDLWYADKPMYKKMYTKFENRYRKLFDASMGDITAADRKQADAEVLSDIVMDFMTTYFIEKK